MNLKRILLQFFLLLWKNFLLQFRRPFGTISEILVPLFGTAVVILLYLSFRTPTQLCFSTFDANSLQFDIPTVPAAVLTSLYTLLFSITANCNFTYFYTPHTPEIAAILNRTKEILSLPYVNIKFVPASSEQEIEKLSADILNDSNSNLNNCRNKLRQYRYIDIYSI